MDCLSKIFGTENFWMAILLILSETERSRKGTETGPKRNRNGAKPARTETEPNRTEAESIRKRAEPEQNRNYMEPIGAYLGSKSHQKTCRVCPPIAVAPPPKPKGNLMHLKCGA